MDIDSRFYDHVVIKDDDIHSIVLSYLVHNCYKETVESFITTTGMQQKADPLDDMDKRKRIFQFALDGNALEAIKLTEQLAPDLLERNKDLYFNLLSLRFVELIRSRKCVEALEFVHTKLTAYRPIERFVDKLEELLALLAYEEPEKSPMFHLLSVEYRQHIADNLNRKILAYANKPSYTSMERLIQQTTIVRQCLSQEHSKDAHHPFSLKDFLKS